LIPITLGVLGAVIWEYFKRKKARTAHAAELRRQQQPDLGVPYDNSLFPDTDGPQSFVPPTTDIADKSPIQMLQEQHDQATKNLDRLKAEGKQLRMKENKLNQQKEVLGRKHASWEGQLRLIDNMILRNMPPTPPQPPGKGR